MTFNLIPPTCKLELFDVENFRLKNKGNFFSVQAKNKICHKIYTPAFSSTSRQNHENKTRPYPFINVKGHSHNFNFINTSVYGTVWYFVSSVGQNALFVHFVAWAIKRRLIDHLQSRICTKKV